MFAVLIWAVHGHSQFVGHGFTNTYEYWNEELAARPQITGLFEKQLGREDWLDGGVFAAPSRLAAYYHFLLPSYIAFFLSPPSTTWQRHSCSVIHLQIFEYIVYQSFFAFSAASTQ